LPKSNKVEDVKQKDLEGGSAPSEHYVKGGFNGNHADMTAVEQK